MVNLNKYIFRGKDSEGQWVYSTCIRIEGVEDEIYLKSEGEWIPIPDSETLCQATGLRDRNGDPIFERDIVSFFASSGTEIQRGEVSYAEGTYWINSNPIYKETGLTPLRLTYNRTCCEVIGNVVDDKERVLLAQWKGHLFIW